MYSDPESISSYLRTKNCLVKSKTFVCINSCLDGGQQMRKMCFQAFKKKENKLCFSAMGIVSLFRCMKRKW